MKAAAKAAAEKKAAAAKKTVDDQKSQAAAELKRRQANLVTQGKAATEKLRKVQSGEHTVEFDQLSMLESKVAFYNEYSSLPKNSEGKLGLLLYLHPSQDFKLQTLKAWMWRRTRTC